MIDADNTPEAKAACALARPLFLTCHSSNSPHQPSVVVHRLGLPFHVAFYTDSLEGPVSDASLKQRFKRAIEMLILDLRLKADELEAKL